MTKSLALGDKRHKLSERGEDLYETPPEAVRALMKFERLPTRIWEPACGPGSIVRTLREGGKHVAATDLVHYDSPDQDASNFDFLMPHTSILNVDAIITNPPYKLAQQFVEKARELVPYTAMLLRLAFLESERRRPILDAGDLARVLVFRKRLPMMHRDGWSGKKTKSSAMAFAWFIWERDHTGPTELYRIDW